MMRFAVNYSAAAAQLVANRLIEPDLFKVPSWPDLIATAAVMKPVYVHFPLRAGCGSGVIDTETRQSPDWAQIEALLATTGTPYVNVHLTPTIGDHPEIDEHSHEPA